MIFGACARLLVIAGNAKKNNIAKIVSLLYITLQQSQKWTIKGYQAKELLKNSPKNY
jgi:hypothetical protein